MGCAPVWCARAVAPRSANHLLAPAVYSRAMQPPPAEPPAPTMQPRDPISRLQCAVSDVCGLYKDALGNLQNKSDELLHFGRFEERNSALDEMATSLADDILALHRRIEREAQVLQQNHRPEDEQMRKLQELQEEHIAVTEELRQETVAAKRVHGELRADLDKLIDGVIEVNSTHRKAAATAYYAHPDITKPYLRTDFFSTPV